MRRPLILSCLIALLATDASGGLGRSRAHAGTFESCGTRSGLGLVFVAGGTLPGDPPRPDGEVADFLIGKYEVTQADWAEVMGKRPSHFGGCAECPVEQVSWNDVQAFLRALTQRTSRAYRLPSETEWEYAASGGALALAHAHAGSDDACAVAWHAANAGGRTHRVGSLQPNALGLFDLCGNVGEWCSASAAVAGVLRGGDWSSGPSGVRIRDRRTSARSLRLDTVGLRLAQSIEPGRANERLPAAAAMPAWRPGGGGRAPHSDEARGSAERGDR